MSKKSVAALFIVALTVAPASWAGTCYHNGDPYECEDSQSNSNSNSNTNTNTNGGNTVAMENTGNSSSHSSATGGQGGNGGNGGDASLSNSGNASATYSSNDDYEAISHSVDSINPSGVLQESRGFSIFGIMSANWTNFNEDAAKMLAEQKVALKKLEVEGLITVEKARLARKNDEFLFNLLTQPENLKFLYEKDDAFATAAKAFLISQAEAGRDRVDADPNRVTNAVAAEANRKALIMVQYAKVRDGKTLPELQAHAILNELVYDFDKVEAAKEKARKKDALESALAQEKAKNPLCGETAFYLRAQAAEARQNGDTETANALSRQAEIALQSKEATCGKKEREAALLVEVDNNNKTCLLPLNLNGESIGSVAARCKKIMQDVESIGGERMILSAPESVKVIQ